MRLMLTGADGQVGWDLRRSLAPLGEVIALDRGQCDLSRPDRLPGIVRGAKPDVIVNAAAYTAVDKAEQEEPLATVINGAAVGVLAEEARKAGSLIVHYSTDYAFDGQKQSPYDEDDAPHPINAYGRSKLAGETAVRQADCDYLVLRSSWIYSARGRNFVQTILRQAKAGGELRIVDDQIGAPTWARDIAEATARIVRAAHGERARKSFASESFNLTAAGATSWYGFAEAILDEATRAGLLQRAPRLTPIASSDYPTPAARPKNSRLACERVNARFGIALPDWRQSLARCIGEMKAA
ncbi:MAG TPA: dTDP-4-dehydrorhamnose reductase [Pseudolabrys sp.]|nr:dTDP-4-dehydrorhamnose reductase [Pseudolabrys sp.]